MSALGQKRTSPYVRVMSALPPKADIEGRDWDVRFVPQADIDPLIYSLDRKPGTLIQTPALKSAADGSIRLGYGSA